MKIGKRNSGKPIEQLRSRITAPAPEVTRRKWQAGAYYSDLSTIWRRPSINMVVSSSSFIRMDAEGNSDQDHPEASRQGIKSSRNPRPKTDAHPSWLNRLRGQTCSADGIEAGGTYRKPKGLPCRCKAVRRMEKVCWT